MVGGNGGRRGKGVGGGWFFRDTLRSVFCSEYNVSLQESDSFCEVDSDSWESVTCVCDVCERCVFVCSNCVGCV